MALKLVASYSKRLGLPGYSSHQFSVSVEAELSNVEDVAGESARLYETLQQSVDQQIQQPGFVPADKPGANGSNSNGHNRGNGNGNGSWACSDKQRDLILSIVDEHKLDRREVDDLAVQRFNKGVRMLNKIEASGLIDELFERHGGQNAGGNANGRTGGYRRGGTPYRGRKQTA